MLKLSVIFYFKKLKCLEYAYLLFINEWCAISEKLTKLFYILTDNRLVRLQVKLSLLQQIEFYIIRLGT